MQINFSIVSENLARIYGDADCIINAERERRYSFREFHLLTNRIANMMRSKLGLHRGDTWLCILNNDSLSLLSPFTAFKGEARACYTNTTDTLADQARQLDLVQPKVVFLEAELLPTHHALLKERNLTLVTMDAAPAQYPDVLNFWTLLEGVSDANPDVLHDDRNDCVSMRFTGGTTGASKAVMYCIDNYLANKDLHFEAADVIPVRAMRMLHFGMISHASGIVFFPVLFKGGCNITMNDRSMLTWCQTVARHRVTASLMVPSMLYRLLDAPEARAIDLSSLQTMYYGASSMSPARIRQLIDRFGDIFVQIYGSSEHPGAVALMSKADHAPDQNGQEAHLASAGRLVPSVSVRIVDRQGRAVPDGQDGEIWMHSRAICLGYLNQPDKTAAEFCDGYWKSGDYGRIDANGFLHVLDRVKDTVIYNQVPVYPSLVEAALSTHPKVHMAAVVGLTDPECGEFVHAEVVLREGEAIEVDELKAYLVGRVTENNIPRTINFTQTLASSAVGKVLRRVIRDACQQKFDAARQCSDKVSDRS